jgi:hypothetical protein
MSEIKHPMRDIPVLVYQRIEGDSGPAFIAKYHPYSVYPIFFHGKTADEAKAQAREFADKAVADHEASYVKRREALLKAREKREVFKNVRKRERPVPVDQAEGDEDEG